MVAWLGPSSDTAMARTPMAAARATPATTAVIRAHRGKPFATWVMSHPFLIKSTRTIPGRLGTPSKRVPACPTGGAAMEVAMLDERKLSVLRAIVEDYVTTREPVGSKALAERHSLGVSPATIRNDMAALEDEGYITQPHTSAGRVPTDTGYRLFVDRLATVKPMSAAERRAVNTFLEGALDLDDIVTRTVR